MRLRSGNEYRALDSPSVLLSLPKKPQIIGVFTDYEEGTVSFFNVEDQSHMYTFNRCLFLERILPFFSPGVCDGGKNVAPLVVIGVNQEVWGWVINWVSFFSELKQCFWNFDKVELCFVLVFIAGVLGVNLILQESPGRKIDDIQILLRVGMVVVTSMPLALTILNIVYINFYYY